MKIIRIRERKRGKYLPILGRGRIIYFSDGRPPFLTETEVYHLEGIVPLRDWNIILIDIVQKSESSLLS